jgi:nucleoside-diphosphate-sugar epimerase
MIMPKILVTGAGGFLGKFIVIGLLRRKVEHVICQVRGTMDQSFLDQCKRDFPESTVSVVRANLLDPAGLDDAVKGVDILIHAAAGTRGATADMVLNSVSGTQNLLKAVIASQIKRVVLVSSFSVYNTEQLASGASLDEAVPTESTGVPRGGYAYSKVRQEQVFDEMLKDKGIETVIVRPGVIYGPGGGEFSGRVGLNAFGWFISLGRGCELPLSYVENCGDACAEVAINPAANGVYNLVDSELPTCTEYLKQFQSRVRSLRVLPVPYSLFMAGAKILDWYHVRSKGQLPALFTPYVVKSMYRPFKHRPNKLLSIGWRQPVPTKTGLERAFASFKK